MGGKNTRNMEGAERLSEKHQEQNWPNEGDAVQVRRGNPAGEEHKDTEWKQNTGNR